uniref:Mesogenin-1-like n=1 Tax=Astyanax mexicanus TaxID=7994 RepID=A0A3B1JQG1_ASTMX
MDPSSQCYHPQSQWSSDSEIYSISSPETVSPAPSMDFNSSSPHHQPKNTRPNKPARTKVTKKAASRRSRLKNPSEQRQNASEKEKLRMRDLTKALHHLRTYLPPSVAPAGQTLTKIETLRLTIRYISYLSSQLGLTEEYLSQRKQMDSSSSSSSSGWRSSSSPELLGYFQCRSTQGQEYTGDYTGQHQHQTGSNLVYTDQSMDMNQHSAQLSEPWTNQIYSSDRSMDTFQPQQCAQLTQSCQVYSYHLVPPAYWS